MVKLIDNEYISQQSHCDQLVDLLTDAVELDWMVAFAKKTGFDLVKNDLDAALSSGNLRRARFIFGLDFYQTDPLLLSAFLKISRNYPGRVSLYITNDGFDGGHQDEDDGEDANEDDRNYLTFHPKLYSFLYADKSYRVMVGSANLTGGGLKLNHELSMLLTLGKPKLIPIEIKEYIDKLISDYQIIPATELLIKNYAERRFIYKTYANNAKIRAKNKANKASPLYDKFDVLRVWLDTMKLDASADGFYSQVPRRIVMKDEAKLVLSQVATHLFTGTRTANSRLFLNGYYGHLVGMANHNHWWASGSLQILMNPVAACYDLFQTALNAFLTADLASGNTLAPQTAYDCLYTNGFERVKGAGVNVMTEILHAYDNNRFPIMNQNSAAAVHLAKLSTIYPNPLKKDDVFSRKLYADFSNDVIGIKSNLGLNDMTEFDALGNYIYWW